MWNPLAAAPVRPWGSGFQSVTVGRSHVVLQAPDGQLWDSVRDAFGLNASTCACAKTRLTNSS
ncbi:hypothetical protein SPAN111604_14340 [Sphingomonas antarctica]